MKTHQKNGKKFKSMCNVLNKTGQGIKFAADTGYRTGYFLGKHPNVEMTKNQIQKNYKNGMLAFLGIAISAFGILKMMMSLRK